MARRRNPPAPQPPASLREQVADLERPVSSEGIRDYGELREIRDRSYRVRTVVKAWKHQQAQDRKLRERYAYWLMLAMAVQGLAVNVAFVLIGCGLLTYEPWTARTFIVAVFGEIAALILLVVKYLFRPPDPRGLADLNGQTRRARRRRRPQPA